MREKRIVYESKPENFNPRFKVVSCFVVLNKKFLLLHRQKDKSEGNTWGVPAGKIKQKEKPEEAIVREIKEETGLDISKEKVFLSKKLFVKYPDYDFIYYMFHTRLDEQKDIGINYSEHKNFGWVTEKEALEMPLILGLDECIKLFFN